MLKLNRALVTGSIILLISINLFNLINFLFQFAMARMLSAADYGILATLFSVVYLTAIFSESMQTIIVKYSAGERNPGKIKNLIKRSIKKSLKISSILFIVYIFAAIPFSFLLKIPYLLLTSIGLMIFATFLSPITRGVLQGQKRFFSFGTNLVLDATIKLVFGILLVFAGWKVYGAVIATLMGVFIAFLLSFLALRKIMKSEERFIQTKEIYAYSKPVFFLLFIIWTFFSLDIIIARIVFSGTTAGYYAIASTMAKVIFLGTQPISKAMFPLTAEKKSDSNNHLLKNALGILFVISLISLAVVYLFPEFLTKLFTGRLIAESASILIYLSIATTLMSFTNLILLYKLSLGKTRNYLVFLAFILIELALLLYFSANLVEFSIALITASAAFLCGSIFFLE